MKIELLTHIAKDGTPLTVYHWSPEYEIGRGVVHILHGLAEHAGRYEILAETLTENGYQVFAHDQRGHGRTAASPEAFGYIGDEGGWNLLVSDAIELCEAEHAVFPHLPVYLFCHSMGTFIGQQIAFERPDLPDAMILSGASGEVGPMVHLGRIIAQCERWRLGPRGRSDIINRLTFDAFNREFAPNRTSFDWLSRNEAEVDRYIADPGCGFIATTSFWVDFLAAIVRIAQPGNRAKIRKNLPIYLFSGRHDPVNRQGRGCEFLAETYRAMGIRNASYRIYAHARHEMLNEVNREEVLEHILEWLDCLRAYERASRQIFRPNPQTTPDNSD